MEKKVLLLIATIWLAVLTASAQEVPAGVIVALKRGSSVELGNYFGEQVEMTLPNRTQTMNKTAAEGEMESFFSRNKVSGFTVNHQGKRNESSFLIGTLNTSTGNYRVTCYLKRMQNKYVIHQVRIDKTNE